MSEIYDEEAPATGSTYQKLGRLEKSESRPMINPVADDDTSRESSKLSTSGHTTSTESEGLPAEHDEYAASIRDTYGKLEPTIREYIEKADQELSLETIQFLQSCLFEQAEEEVLDKEAHQSVLAAYTRYLEKYTTTPHAQLPDFVAKFIASHGLRYRPMINAYQTHLIRTERLRKLTQGISSPVVFASSSEAFREIRSKAPINLTEATINFMQHYLNTWAEIDLDLTPKPVLLDEFDDNQNVDDFGTSLSFSKDADDYILIRDTFTQYLEQYMDSDQTVLPAFVGKSIARWIREGAPSSIDENLLEDAYEKYAENVPKTPEMLAQMRRVFIAEDLSKIPKKAYIVCIAASAIIASGTIIPAALCDEAFGKAIACDSIPPQVVIFLLTLAAMLVAAALLITAVRQAVTYNAGKVFDKVGFEKNSATTSQKGETIANGTCIDDTESSASCHA